MSFAETLIVPSMRSILVAASMAALVVTAIAVALVLGTADASAGPSVDLGSWRWWRAGGFA